MGHNVLSCNVVEQMDQKGSEVTRMFKNGSKFYQNHTLRNNKGKQLKSFHGPGMALDVDLWPQGLPDGGHPEEVLLHRQETHLGAGGWTGGMGELEVVRRW